MMPRPPPDPLYTLKSDSSPVHSLSFWEKSKNEKLFAGCQSGQVQLWSLKTNRSIEGLQAHSGPCINVSCVNDNLVTQGKGDGLVKIWHSLEGGGWAPSFTIHTRHSIFCRFCVLGHNTGGDSLIICPEESHSVGVYSLNSGKRLSNVDMEDFKMKAKSLGYVMALKSYSDPFSGRPMLLVAHEGGQLSMRDILNGGKEICCLNVGEPVLCLDFDPIEGVGIYGSPESSYIRKFSMNSRTGTSDLGSHTPITNPGISSIRIRPDSKIVATGGWDSRLRIFAWQRTVEGMREKDEIGVAIRENGGESADVCSQKDRESVCITETSSDVIGVEFGVKTSQTGNPNEVVKMKHSESDGNDSPIVAANKNFHLVPVFKKPMKPLAVLKHHTKTVQTVAFSIGAVESWECSCLLAAGSDDGGISLWDLYN